MLLVMFHYASFTTAQNDPGIAQFNIVVQNHGDKLELECLGGCEWKKLSFALMEGQQLQFVNAFGMTPTNDKELSGTERADGFLISFERKGEKIYCTSQQGTNWNNLSFSCTKTHCHAQIDHSGVSVMNNPKE
jgi:hypothetical protein